jgi:hypothetical protein
LLVQLINLSYLDPGVGSRFPCATRNMDEINPWNDSLSSPVRIATVSPAKDLAKDTDELCCSVMELQNALRESLVKLYTAQAAHRAQVKDNRTLKEYIDELRNCTKRGPGFNVKLVRSHTKF